MSVGRSSEPVAAKSALRVPLTAARVDAPWLILHGEKDLTVGLEEAHKLARVARGGMLRVVEGAGHTYDVAHPFERTSPALEEAVDATLAHFARHLETG